MEETHSSSPSGRHGWKRWLSGWRAGGASLVALALAMIPCGIACALGICVLDRSKTKPHCDSGKSTSQP